MDAKSKISTVKKTKIWETCTLPALTYGAQIWALAKTNIKNYKQQKKQWRGAVWRLKRKKELKTYILSRLGPSRKRRFFWKEKKGGERPRKVRQ